ncbi:hypothetical protein J4206_01205 [Candidatus Woesearchaeota archaeon]|nr:hypothetical protein [Candidatus Woesearchaeota archaeon]
MKEPQNIDLENAESFGDEDIYNEEIIHEFVENDEISSEENGFMQGYLSG